MKLEKSDALLLHSVLFAYANSNVALEFVDIAHLEDLFGRLQDYISGESESCTDSPSNDHHDDHDDDDDEEDYDDNEEDAEEPVAEKFVTCQSAADLSPIEVFSPDGSKVKLEFEDVGEESTVDALVDDGTIIIDAVSCVVLTNQNVSLYDGEEWHDFKIKKVPKSWARVFPHGRIIGFSGDE